MYVYVYDTGVHFLVAIANNTGVLSVNLSRNKNPVVKCILTH